MRCFRIDAAIAVSVFLSAAPAAPAGDVLSTRQVGAPTEWSNVSRWMNEPAVSTFPNNGNEGMTFDVVIPGTTVSLDIPIEIDSLNILGIIEHNGLTLDVQGPVIMSFGTFNGGTLSATGFTVNSGFTLNDTNATANLLTLNGNGGVALNDGSALTINGNGNDNIVMIGDGDIDRLDGSSFVSFPSGGVIRKFSGGGLSEIEVPIVTSTLNIINQSGGLKFDLAPQSWSTLDVDLAAAATVEFADGVSVDNVMVDGDEATGAVTFRNVVTLGGTLTTTTNAPGSRVVITGSGPATGILSGGVLNAATDLPVVLAGAGQIGTLGQVRNMGRLHWEQGFIMESGLVNESTAALVTTPGAGGDRVVSGGTLINEGSVVHDHPIVLDLNGRIENAENAIWNAASNLNAPPDVVATTRFVSDGLLLGLDDAVFNVPAEFTGGSVSIDAATTLTTTNTTILRDVTIEAVGDRGVILTPTGFGAEHRLEDVVTIQRISEIDGPVLEIAGADYTLDGDLVHGATAARADVVLSGSAGLDGGVLDLDGQGAFIQQGASTLGANECVTNLGAYELQGGTIGVGGLDNFGAVDIKPGDGAAPTIFRFVNAPLAAVRLEDGTIRLEAPGVTNTGAWTNVGNVIIEYLVETATFPFDNAGTFSALGLQTSVLVDVNFDNTGVVEAEAADITFTNGVVQFDPATQTLSGGEWRARFGGTITIVGEELFVIRAIESPAKYVVDAPELTLESPLEQLEKLSGDVDLINAARADLRGNDAGGDLVIEDSGIFRDGESILGPGSGPARLIANRITNRGEITVFNTGVIQADVALDLLDGGVLNGDLGVVETPQLNNTSGRVEPGYPAGFELIPGAGPVGSLQVLGEYTQSANGGLRIELAGPSTADALSVTGAATLGGTLELILIDDYEPMPGDSFEILTAATISGTFDAIMSSGAVDVAYEADRVVVTFTGPSCDGDLDGSGEVGPADLATILGAWGPNPGSPADLDGDGVVGAADLAMLLGAWGGCE